MVRGLYTSASGMLVAQQLANTVANNLANVNTNGFKQTLLEIQSAPTLDIYRLQTDPGPRTGSNALPGVPVAAPVGQLGTGAWIYDTPETFAQGPLQATGNPYDLALGGTNAFFNVQTPQGVRYTRDGQFTVNPNGNLVTMDGNYVLGQNGPIQVQQQQGAVTVGPDGTVSQNGITIDRLALTRFNNLVDLRKQGNNLFVDTGNAQPQPTAGATVIQGSLEKSNSNVVRSMVDLIVAERWFDSNSKSVKMQDQATQLAIQDVGTTA
ncbi:MAG: flagellar basal-body rod protein FlgF [Candidatus Baltobacteraceae bacterium]